MDIKKSGGNPNRHSENDIKSYELVEKAFQSSNIELFDKLESFSRFSSKRSIARFLLKNEIFREVINTNGVIIECGVFNGAGLFTWAQLSNIYEPTNYTRKIIGFDTFEGFTTVSSNDENTDMNPMVGDLRGADISEYALSVEKYYKERHLAHIPNIELIKGDFMKTGEAYLNTNKHVLISLLYLDFDVYEPTKRAIELFLPRMSKGSIICFDQLNCPNFPGETTALLESIDLRNYKISRSNIDPWISWIVL